MAKTTKNGENKLRNGFRWNSTNFFFFFVLLATGIGKEFEYYTVYYTYTLDCWMIECHWYISILLHGTMEQWLVEDGKNKQQLTQNMIKEQHMWDDMMKMKLMVFGRWAIHHSYESMWIIKAKEKIQHHQMGINMCKTLRVAHVIQKKEEKKYFHKLNDFIDESQYRWLLRFCISGLCVHIK